MDKIESRRIGSLRLHSDNVKIFGLPTDEPNYEEIRADIQRRGLQEPLIILPDGTILSGHIRYSGVCWTLEQKGLTKAQIEDELIQVRVHPDFDSKEEELDYLMSANAKRRHLSPRGIARMYERTAQVLEEHGIKAGKKETLASLVDRMGTSHKLAKNYFIIFSSRIVPDEYKDRLDAKSIAPATIIEAIKFAEDTAKRETRAASIDDVVIYLKNPKPRTSLADTVRQVTKGATSTQKPATATPPVVTQTEEPPVTKPASVPAPGIIDLHLPISSISIPEEVRQQSGLWKEALNLDTSQTPAPTDLDKVRALRTSLKETLKSVSFEEVSSELLGLHTELSTYLQAMGKLEPPPMDPFKLGLEDQITFCSQLIFNMQTKEVLDPERARDSLLELTTVLKDRIRTITTAKTKLEENGLFCPLCLEPQLDSPCGTVCSKGHGGLPGISANVKANILISEELTGHEYKCAHCDSRVEASKHGTHANCPRCGLVDMSDVEQIDNRPTEEDMLNVEPQPELADAPVDDFLLGIDEPEVSLKSDDILSADEIESLLKDQEPPKAPEPVKQAKPEPARAPESKSPAKTKIKAEPKRESQPIKIAAPPTPPAADATSDEDYVSSVIDDFMDELSKAGVSAQEPS